MTEPQPNEDQNITSDQRLTAIRLLTMRIERRNQAKKAATAEWREVLDTKTRALNELIEEETPIDDEEACVARLDEIRLALKNRRQAETDKKSAIGKINAEIEQAESARYEMIMTEGATQSHLNFAEDGAAEPWLTSEAAREVGLALNDVAKDSGGDLAPEMDALRRRVESMGLGKIRLVDEDDGEEDDEEESEDKSEAGPDF